MERSLKPDCEEAEQLSHKNGLGSSLDAAHDDITGLGLWMMFSIAAAFSTKWILSDDVLPLPAFLTLCQMLFSSIALQLLRSRFHSAKKMTYNVPHDTRQLGQVILLSLLSSAAHLLLNYAYLHLHVSSIEMIKILPIPIISILSQVFQCSALENSSRLRTMLKLVGVLIICLATGITFGSIALYAGLILEAIVAVCIEALRLSALKDRMVILSYLAPICTLVSLSLVLVFERDLVDIDAIKTHFPLVVLNAILVFSALCTSSYVKSEVFTPLSISNSIRDFVAILCSLFIWPTHTGFVNWLGYAIAIGSDNLQRGSLSFARGLPWTRLLSTIFVVVLALFSVILDNSPEPESGATIRTNLVSIASIGKIPIFPPIPTLEDIPGFHKKKTPKSGRLARFLQHNGFKTTETLFLTISDKNYIEQAVQFKARLDHFYLSDQYVVLCLDPECVEGMRAKNVNVYDGYVITDLGDWHMPVAAMKLELNLDLIDGGYNFVLMDADVYLTGSRHPLSGMRPISDPSWSIQFQSDNHDGNDSTVNIGWYWARPTPILHEFFLRASQKWNQTHEWDQKVMNDVRFEMIAEGSLSYPASIVLKSFDYTCFQKLYNWSSIYIDTDLIDQLQSERVLVHTTGLGNLYKHFVAKHLGLWYNEEYYTRPIRLLEPINVGGSDDDIFREFALAVHLAKVSNRTFLWPMWVNSTRGTVRVERKPPLLIVDVYGIEHAVPWVEATYLHNRARFTAAALSESSISVMETLLVSDWLAQLDEQCTSHKEDILRIDFDQVDFDILESAVGMDEVVADGNLFPCQGQEICY